tara:strand:- start:123 stop:323 length:201 start_codon:yes stop_codon:yes gene_type:complete
VPLLKTFYTYKINILPSNRRENDGICPKNRGYDPKSVGFGRFRSKIVRNLKFENKFKNNITIQYKK